MSNAELLGKLKEKFLDDSFEDEVVELAKEIVEADINVMEAIDVASEAIREVGDAFEEGELFLPDLMIAGEKMKRCMDVFRPHLTSDDAAASRGCKLVLGTVSGDIHDIGKNLVGTMLTIGGYQITDMDVNVPPLDFVSAVREHQAEMVALSALMTASLPYQKEVVTLLNEMGLREKVYVIIGGGPVTVEYAEEIGADGWAENAAAALKLADKLLASDKKPTEAFITA